jgi:hypothetical protein
MTTLARLLGRKRQLIGRLQEEPGPHERDSDRMLLQREAMISNLLGRVYKVDRLTSNVRGRAMKAIPVTPVRCAIYTRVSTDRL